MKTLSKSACYSLLAVFLLAVQASAQSIQKNKYKTIEVHRFTIQQGVQCPADYMITLTDDLVNQLQRSGKFTRVIREGEIAGKDGSLPMLRLTGEITQFKPGSRAKRYLIGFGAGTTKIVAHVKFADPESGQVLYEGKADGKVWIGVIGGESAGATNGLAKEIVKIARKQFF